MKVQKIIYVFVPLLLLSGACTKSDFLEKYPLDQISSVQYWKHTSDLKLYVNQFYSKNWQYGGFTNDDATDHSWTGGIYWWDVESDNMVGSDGKEPFSERIAGTRSVPASAGDVAWLREEGQVTWYFTIVRDLNIFFENYRKCEDSFDDYKQYVGEAHFFRAWEYYRLVKGFGDVPWYDKVLDADSPELYKPRDPRNFVIDKVLADLDTAAMYMVSEPNEGGTRINKECALLMKSRVALYEGTWEKYHNGDPFGVTNPDPEKYLNQAVEAAREVMNSGYYGLYSTGDPEHDYFNLFVQTDYSDNKEVLFWKKYDLNLDMRHFHNTETHRFFFGAGITKSLADDYLCKDGLPISLSPQFKGYDSLMVERENRDPRFTQTIYTRGDPWLIKDGDTSKIFYKSGLNLPSKVHCKTGYQIRKGSDSHYMQYRHPNTTATPFFRYAEVLLNYAEAKAELGTLTQGDVDISINLLRKRVGMPDLDISNIPTDPAWHYPSLSPVINEIRRERRIELAVEGYRWDDIARWAAADELIVGKNPKGVFFVQHYWEVSDPVLDPFYDDRFPLVPGDNVDLDENDFVMVFKDKFPNGWGFDINRDYLNPIPINELTLNPSLKQNPGW